MEYLKNKKKRPIKHLISAPFIYGMIFPAIFFDFCLEIYHNICFRLYGIPRVKRSRYILIDRHHLKYLNHLQRLNCLYCGYFNGLMSYAKTIAGETEKYWCAIKHEQQKEFQEPEHHENFLDYGDEAAFNQLSKVS